LAAAATWGVQLATGWEVTPAVLQVIVCQPLPAFAVCGVQDATATLVVVVGMQIVAV
jgi:hypothetical protein